MNAKKPRLPLFVLAVVGSLGVLGGLALLRAKPWVPDVDAPPTLAEQAREALTVGYLPVTCHLTCPVTDFASRTSGKGRRFDSLRFGDFPTVTESVKSGRLDATFMIAPLAMKLREQGVKVKIVYLGHRDGSTLIVRKGDPAQSIADLVGRKIAIPSRYSNQYLVIQKLMDDKALSKDAIEFVELPPPEMPSALANGAIDAYFVGEPHAARAELADTGRILHHAKDIWPNFISCALVVTESLIERNPEAVRDLVRGIAESGEWIERNREDAARVGAAYYKQDEALVKHALTKPLDRVKYTNLTPQDPEFEKMQAMAVKVGILEKEVDIHELVDRQFIPDDIAPADIKSDLTAADIKKGMQ